MIIKNILLLLLLPFFCLSNIRAETFANKQIYILGDTASGTNWLKYCIKDILDLETIFYENIKYLNPKKNDPDFIQDYIKTHKNIINGHVPNITLSHHNLKEDILIVLLRNYRDCNLDRTNNNLIKYNRLIRNSKNIYFSILQTYEDWNPSKKHLIYYEDLEKKPTNEIKKLANFLKQRLPLKYNSKIKLFKKNIETHKQNGLTIQSKPLKERKSNINLNYYNGIIPPSNCRKVDKYIENTYPILWKKYLSRYAYEK